MKRIKQSLYIFALMVCTLPVSSAGPPVPYPITSVVDSLHNLSIYGQGTVKAASEPEICVFCHTPHNGGSEAPLWNRSTPNSSYTPYSSSTISALPGQPTGSSLLCLSCHDGTIALGDVSSRPTPIAMMGSSTIEGTANLGTDLSNDHPISFVYTGGPGTERRDPASFPNLISYINTGAYTGLIKLDQSGQMQCTSCHDAHNNSFGKFLVMPNTASALCTTCHIKNNWTETAHSTSTKTWNNVLPDPWPTTDGPTVAANGCDNCHTSHNAGGSEHILKYAAEEENCYTCHNGHVASENIQAEFSKASVHPIATTTGVHIPLAKPEMNKPGEPLIVGSARHVECEDCHNPHAARANPSNPPLFALIDRQNLVQGVLKDVRGVKPDGNEVLPIGNPYELCLRCHTDGTAPKTDRQFNKSDLSEAFKPSALKANASYHPVAEAGKNISVPSLIGSLTPSSLISCLDCHNNNEGPGAGGVRPRGPHGSDYPSLLERQYKKLVGTIESSSSYALCYKCHNRSSILANDSFPRHSRYIQGTAQNPAIPCNVCHDPHASDQERLINFDTKVVSEYLGQPGQLTFSATANGGTCTLACHGTNHNACTYNKTTGDAVCP